MNSVNGIPGLNPGNFSNSTALKKLKKPPVLHNPIANAESTPMRADVNSVQRVKSADRAPPFSPKNSPDFSATEASLNIRPPLDSFAGGNLGDPSAGLYSPTASPINSTTVSTPAPGLAAALGGAAAKGDLSDLTSIPYSPAAAQQRLEAAAKGDLSGLTSIPYSPAAAQQRLEAALLAGRLAGSSSPEAAEFDYVSPLAGAGIGGLLGNLLYRGTRDKDDETTFTGNALSTLAGAGLGGGLGYLLSKQGFAAGDRDTLKRGRRRQAIATEKLAAAKDIVDTSSFSGALADIIPLAWGGERAGRTQAMAEAIDEPTTFGVRHPFTSDWLYSLAGGGLGALGGGIAGGIGTHLLNRALANDVPGRGFLGNDVAPALIGAGAGAGLGGGAGALLGRVAGAMARRDEMQRIGGLYDAASAAGKVDPKDPKFSLLSAAFLPLRGPHRMGQRDAVTAMRDNDKLQRSTFNDVGYLASALSAIPVGPWAQNVVTQLDPPSAASKPTTNRKQKKKNKDERDDVKAAAVVLTQRLNKAASAMKWERVFLKLAEGRKPKS